MEAYSLLQYAAIRLDTTRWYRLLQTIHTLPERKMVGAMSASRRASIQKGELLWLVLELLFLFSQLTNLNVIQRLDQLVSKGTSPELIDRLAKDAQKYTEFRSILQSQVREAKKFVTDYCQRYNANKIPKDIELLTDEFEFSVNNRIGQLDQTVRDLLQIVSIMHLSFKS